MPASSGNGTAVSTLEEIERQHILRVLEASGGNKTKAAQILRIDYKTLLGRLKQYEAST